MHLKGDKYTPQCLQSAKKNLQRPRRAIFFQPFFFPSNFHFYFGFLSLKKKNTSLYAACNENTQTQQQAKKNRTKQTNQTILSSKHTAAHLLSRCPAKATLYSCSAAPDEVSMASASAVAVAVADVVFFWVGAACASGSVQANAGRIKSSRSVSLSAAENDIFDQRSTIDFFFCFLCGCDF
jgi:hypothetical protein